MQIQREVINRLAEAWLEEAKRLRAGATCDCGCGKPIAVSSRTRFKPGHDAKLLKGYRNKIREVLGVFS